VKKGQKSRAFQGKEGHRRQIFVRLVPCVFEIVFGHPLDSETFIPVGAQDFVSTMIISGLHVTSQRGSLFDGIPRILKDEKFRIDKNVDSAFISWVESGE
jgi:hypothetical protein